jgi:hypothetical protein
LLRKYECGVFSWGTLPSVTQCWELRHMEDTTLKLLSKEIEPYWNSAGNHRACNS